MGKAIEGDFVEWPRTAEVGAWVRERAVEELLDLWERGKGRKGDPPLWGDEIEYCLVELDESKRKADLCLRQSRTLRRLERATESQVRDVNGSRSLRDLEDGMNAGYSSEFTKYMVESEPAKPYESSIDALLKVEQNMKERRTAIKRQLQPNEHVFTLSIFPRLGAEESDGKPSEEPSANSNLISTEARYQAADENINGRRGRDLDISVPLFIDSHTLSHERPFPSYINPDTKSIHLDSILFGPGHCGFQVTFQGADMDEARTLHDQLVPLGPIMLALTAATPIYRGYLADTDARWNQIAAAVDDRPPKETRPNAERAALPQRWAANETYIARDPRLKPSHQRTDLPINKSALRRLQDAGMDPVLARHFAYILSRDPLIISEADTEAAANGSSNTSNTPNSTSTSTPASYSNSTSTSYTTAPSSASISDSDSDSADAPTDAPPTDPHAHLTSLLGTTWPHVRFKPPPPDAPGTGWCVEFRAMEAQPTDFENAAFALFLVLLRRAVARYGLNFYMPIDRVKANMQAAHKRDAVRGARFWWGVGGGAGANREDGEEGEDDGALLSVDDIVNGCDAFEGLLPLVERYLRDEGVSAEQRERLGPYLQLVRGRASGKLWTPARWMREFVRAHEGYKGDSCVRVEVCYDLMREVESMVAGVKKGRMFVPEGR